MFDFFKNYKLIELYAPIEGIIKSIEEVPDNVFAEKIVGDGIALEPTCGIVVAPCDGKIVQITSANHAVGMETDSGLEILIHIGMDTVELKGDGFKRIAKIGDHVKKGDVLLEADLERIKLLGKPIITPFIIMNTDQGDIVYTASGKAAAGRTVVMKVKMKKEKN